MRALLALLVCGCTATRPVVAESHDDIPDSDDRCPVLVGCGTEGEGCPDVELGFEGAVLTAQSDALVVELAREVSRLGPRLVAWKMVAGTSADVPVALAEARTRAVAARLRELGVTPPPAIVLQAPGATVWFVVDRCD